MALFSLLFWSFTACESPSDPHTTDTPRRPPKHRVDTGLLTETGDPDSFDTGAAFSDSGFPDRRNQDPEDSASPDPTPGQYPGTGISSVCHAWTFDRSSNGWTLSGDLSLSGSQSAGSTRFEGGNDPFLHTSLSADLSRCTLVDVVMKVSGPESYWEVFWRRQQDGQFSAERRKRFQLFSDEQWHRYVFDLGSHPDWSGTLSHFRLDPRAGGGSIEVRSIRLIEPDGAYPPEMSLSDVEWLHHNVSSWSQTSTMAPVSIGNGQVCMNHDGAQRWATSTCCGGVEVNANPWVFAWKPSLESLGGQWYAATWEWMRPGQTCKNSTSVAGDHIKQSPFHSTSGWRPSSGEALYFMVSGLARGSERNQAERTDIQRVAWP